MLVYKIPESVLVVIHTQDLQVLLLERAGPGNKWQSVTGSKAHPQESLKETACREVQEETGLVIGSANLPMDALRDWQCQLKYEIYPMWQYRYAPGVSHNTEHWFGLTVPTNFSPTLCADEHTAWQWLPWREAATRCFSPSNHDAILQLPMQMASTF